MPRVEKEELAVVRSKLICECGGEMRFSPTESNQPSRNVHRCLKCGVVEAVRGKMYPHVFFEEREKCSAGPSEMCVHKEPWEESGHRREFTSGRWRCKRCGRVVATPAQAGGIDAPRA